MSSEPFYCLCGKSGVALIQLVQIQNYSAKAIAIKISCDFCVMNFQFQNVSYHKRGVDEVENNLFIPKAQTDKIQM